MSFEDFSDASAFGFDGIDYDIDPMPGEVRYEICSRAPRVNGLLLSHSKHTNPLGPFKNWHGVSYRSRRGTTEIPSDDNGIDREWSGALAGVRQNNRRMP